MIFGESHKFSTVDYVLFSASLCLSTAIGFFYACTGGKQRTTSEFLFGDRHMQILPVTLSLIATCTSAIGVLGFPTEIYKTGAIYFTNCFSIFGCAVIAVYFFLPVFHKLKLASTYEYLELRFSKIVRRIAMALFMLHMVFFMAMCLYGPSLALSQVTGLSLTASMLGSGLVCTLYTTIGGIKAVVLTDAIQETLVLSGLLGVIIQGVLLAGGIDHIWNIASKGHRTTFFDFNFDPTDQHTSWSLILGGFFSWLPMFSCNQTMVQRYLSLGSLNRARKGMCLLVPIFIILHGLYLFCGLVMYAYYADCDPLLNHQIDSYTQLLPLFIMETLGKIVGLPGLFLAAVYSASLSTISSGLNSISAVILEDVVRPVLLYKTKKSLKDQTAAKYSKLIALVFGLVTIAIAFLAELVGKGIYQVAVGLDGVFGGPLLGIFTLGIFVPWANSEGALVALLLSLCFNCWIGMGNIFFSPEPSILPLGHIGCGNITNSTESSWNNSSILSNQTDNLLSLPEKGLSIFYSISYFYYSLFGFLIVIICGTITSYLTGFKKMVDVDPQLISPFFEKFYSQPPIYKTSYLLTNKDENMTHNSEKLQDSLDYSPMPTSFLCSTYL